MVVFYLLLVFAKVFFLQISNEEAPGKVENHKLLKAPPGKAATNNHVKSSRPGILPADGYHLQQQNQLYGNNDSKTSAFCFY